MKKLKLLLVLLLVTAFTNAQNFVKRINCGSNTSFTHNGDTFDADTSVPGSVTFDGELNGTFNLNLPEHLKSIRYTKNANREMFYNITVPQAGDYQVILHFAEPYWGVFSSGNGHGVRVFDVLVEGTLVRDNMDIVQEVGPHQVLTVNHIADVQDGVLTLEFDASANDPIINAIEVIEIDNSDNQNPTAPTLSSSGTTATTVDLSWSGATDNIGVTNYKIYKDGSLETTLGNVSTYQVTGLTAETSYDFTITALDAAANESTASNVETVTTSSSQGPGSTVWHTSGNDINYTAGKVGIGTANPDYELTVKGKIHTEEVKVDLSVPAPDYVFNADYDLRSLSEVRDHIKTHGHLPNIPSATDMERQGIHLGTFQMKLLEKIEELTLYLLQQEGQIKQLQQRRSLLETQLSKTETRVNN